MRDCNYVWNNLFINAKGEVFSCCLEQPEVLGNIKNFNFKKFHEKLEVLRMLEKNDSLFCSKDCLIVPKNNTFYQRINQFKRLNRLHIEWGYKCNANCYFCFQRKLSQKTQLKYNDFYNFIKHFEIDEFQIQGGEPLVISECKELIQFICKKLKARLLLQTNGIALNPKYFEELKNGLTKIIISLNAATEETYFKIMGVNKFSTVIDNIGYMVKSPNHNVFIETHMTIVPENVLEIISFIKLSKKLNVNSISFCPNCEKDRAIEGIRNDNKLKKSIRNEINELISSSCKLNIDKSSQEYIYKLTEA